MQHRAWTAILFALLIVGGGLWWLARPPSPSAIAQVNGRRDHTATLLHDGTILVVGGRSFRSNATAVVERYDPRTGLWHDAGRLRAARRDHTASLLPDGSVLIVGGVGAGFWPGDQWQGLAVVERYQPDANRWSTVAPLPVGITDQSAIALPDGSILIAGGRDQDAVPYRETDAVWRYDPTHDRWQALAALQRPRFRSTGVALADGHVLVVGGSGPLDTDSGRNAEGYDPQRGMWQLSPNLSTALVGTQQVAVLADGRVLVVNGAQSIIYAPQREDWRAAAAVSPLATDGSLTALPDGRALLVARTIEGLYDSLQDRWQLWQRPISRVGHTATLLPDGKVVLIGGQDVETTGPGQDVELVQP